MIVFFICLALVEQSLQLTSCNVGVSGPLGLVPISRKSCTTKCQTTSVIVQAPFLGKLTINTYSCYNSKLNPRPAGTIIAGSLGTSITNFCSTDNCNTGKATDTATLWCNLGVNGGPFNGLFKQSCTGSCGTGTLAGFTGFACIPNCISGQTISMDFFGFQANITISNCCNTNYCNTNNKVGRQDSFSNLMRTKRSMTQVCDILFQLEQDENEYERSSRLDLCSKILKK